MISPEDGNDTQDRAQRAKKHAPTPYTPPSTDDDTTLTSTEDPATNQEETYAPRLNFGEDIWPTLPKEDRLAHIMTHLDDPERWYDMPIIETLAEFYHEKIVWGSIKARARRIGLNPFDLDAAVKTIVRRTARQKLLEAMQGDVHAITPDDLVANFTETEWLLEETLLFLTQFYTNAAVWMRLKAAAKKCGVNDFDLERAVKQAYSRQGALHPPTRNGMAQVPMMDLRKGSCDVTR